MYNVKNINMSKYKAKVACLRVWLMLILRIWKKTTLKSIEVFY